MVKGIISADWGGYGMGPGMMGPGYGYGMGWGWGIVMMVFWVLVIVGIVLLIRWLIMASRPGAQGGPQQGESALDILKRRYARGEMDREEFEQKKKDLS